MTKNGRLKTSVGGENVLIGCGCIPAEVAWTESGTGCRKDFSIWEKMAKKDASTAKLPVDQYRKQIGKQDYKKTKPALRATRLKAEAKKSAPGIRDTILVIMALLVFLLGVYAFFYLNLSSELNLDTDLD
ncbi:hypothetical protein KOW79_010691 [Hemibagrus wyckioides]|uniref:Triple QxxK/R motif-containing protein n=2 Tax=Hemibagrus wyckioides TaxID=337641 RepID=A0A9D3NLH2_9TELE|nr:hypothetical protein KOW79_010691 [Hemibagrus wyckioides]